MSQNTTEVVAPKVLDKDDKPKKHSAEWHKDHCPCKGKPQKDTKRLIARTSAWVTAGHSKTQLNEPGSQNRNK